MAEAFGKYISPTVIDRTGISAITKDDIEKAKAEHKKIKLIAKAELIDGNAVASVKPTFIDEGSMLAQVRNEFNGILISCNMADDIFLSGRGAGMDPTGSAVAGDIMEIAKLIKK